MTTSVNTAVPDYIVNGVLTDTEAWVAIQTSIIGSGGTSNITWTSTTGANDWSQYMDLMIVAHLHTGNSGSSTVICEPNAVTYTGSSYTAEYWSSRFDTDGSTISGITWAGYPILALEAPGTSDTSGVFASATMLFNDINSGKFKSAWSQAAMDTGAAGGHMGMAGVTAQRQTPITSIKCRASSGANISEYSRFDLFGCLPRMVS